MLTNSYTNTRLDRISSDGPEIYSAVSGSSYKIKLTLQMVVWEYSLYILYIENNLKRILISHQRQSKFYMCKDLI